MKYDRKKRKYRLRILDARVCRMPTHGRMAHVGRAIGWTVDDRAKTMGITLGLVQKACGGNITLITDANTRYPAKIRAALPNAQHYDEQAYTAATGDPNPLWWLNHACSMLRHNVSRLKRQAMTFSQRLSRLQKHLYLQIAWTNGYSVV